MIVDAFEAGQLTQATSTTVVVARIGARFGAGDDALARQVRERQDAANAWRRFDKRVVETMSQPPENRNMGADDCLRGEIKNLIKQFRDRIFPKNSHLNPKES